MVTGIAQVPVTADKRGVSEESLATRRFRSLLHQLGAEQGYGWQTEVAERLGVSRSYISRILNNEGDQNVGRKTLEAAQRALLLTPRFWTADGPDDLDHRAFVIDAGGNEPSTTGSDDHSVSLEQVNLALGDKSHAMAVLAHGIPSFSDWITSSEADALSISEAVVLGIFGQMARSQGYDVKPFAYSAVLGVLRILPKKPTSD